MANQDSDLSRVKSKEHNTQMGGKSASFASILSGFKGGSGNPTSGGGIAEGTRKPRGKK